MVNGDVHITKDEKIETLTCAEMIDCLVTLLTEKNILTINPEEYAGALDKYYNQLVAAKQSRKVSRDQQLDAMRQRLQGNVRNVVVGIILVTFLAIVVSGSLLVVFKPALRPSTMPVNSGTLLTFLGFVVALAAYLATVARSLKDKITALKEKTQFDANQITRHAENLMRIIRAEALLVAVGMSTIGRMIVGPLMNVDVTAFDYFLLIYMVFTILYLCYLHAKQWTYNL
jgi:hypothetical protein